jgi:hypothetical protein
MGADDLPTIGSLAALADLVTIQARGEALYVRWSRGPADDLADERPSGQTSRDALTGVVLPGLSANPLRIEPWWGTRSVSLWVARRLYDYRHLRELRGTGVRPWVLLGTPTGRGPDNTGVRPWVLLGTPTGRGPDNEPLVICRKPIAWISEAALRECEIAISRQESPEWGPLDRRA